MKRFIKKHPQHHAEKGFTLVEVMIAGLIMGGTMIGVSQLAAQAMAGNNNQNNRNNIEAAINNDIQLIQQQDSQLTYQWIDDNGDSEDACLNPGRYLALELGEEDSFTDKNGNVLFNRTATGKTIDGGERELLTQVKYSFEGPEQSINSENRIIELSPSFQANCYQ